MSEPLFTPRSGIGAKYKDSSTGKEYVFTKSGWKPMSVDIQQETADANTFVVKPEEKELETKWLQGGATQTDVSEALTKMRRIETNSKSVKTTVADDTPPIVGKKLKNPFRGMTKEQAVLHAYNKGMTDIAELDKLEKLYDKLVPQDAYTIDENTMKIADPLRAEYFARTKESGYLPAKQMYEKIRTIENTPAGDISLIFAYMKLLDPASVVRESEQSLAQNAGSFGSKVQNAISQITSGKRLQPEQVQDFKRSATAQYKIYKSQQDKIDSQYSLYAKRAKIDPSLLMIGLYEEAAVDSNGGDALNIMGAGITSDNQLGL